MKKVLFILFLGLVAGGAAAQVDPSYIDAQRPDKEVLITKDSVLTYFNLGSFLQDSLGIPYDNLANGAVLVGSPSGGITSYPLQFYYANADKLLGIGTTSPEAGIHIANNRVSLAKFERTTSDSAFFELVNSVQTYYFQINEDGSFEIKQGNERPFKIGDQVEINSPVWFKDTIRSYDGTTGAVGHVWTVAANGKPEWTDPGTLTNDDQRFDTAAITDDTLYLSLTGDGEPAKEIDLKPYSNTADDQAIEQFDISNDSLRLKLENSAQARVFLEDFKQDTQSLYVVGDSLAIRRGNKVDLNELRTSQEEIEDIVGGMVSGNTETDITVDYDDPTGKLNFVVSGGGGGSDDQTVDTFELSGTDLRLSLEGDGEPFNVVDLSGLGGGTDDQTIDTLQLNGTTLEISLEDDAEAKQTVDLSSLQDGTGTDDQTIDKLNLNGTTLEVSLEDDGAPDVTVDLSSLQDGTGTDDQDLTLTGNTLAIENDPNTDVDLSPYLDNTDAQTLSFGTGTGDLTITNGNTVSLDGRYLQSEVDGSITNEIQTIDTARLVGTNLELSLSDDSEAKKTVDLSSLQDGTGSDDQTVDKFNLNGTMLELSLEDDGQPDETVDLSSLQDGTGTDDQDLTLVGNTLSIENDPNTDVDLTPYEKLTQTEVQDYVKPMVTGNIETLIDVTVTSQRFDFVVEDDLSLYDNTTSGFLTNEVDGSVTNEIQTIDTFRLVGTTLEGSLSSDGEAKKTVDLSSLQDGVFDADAIHDNVDDEFSGVSQKLEPSNADRILIEDSGASFAKKWIRIDSLPNAGGGGGSDGVATGGTHDQINRELDITVAAPGSNFSIDISALPTDLEDLTDVGLPIAYTNRFALLADGTDFHARAITEADISDLQSYLTSEVDGSVTNELQTIDTFRLVGTTLEASLSSDSEAKKTIDLSSLQDGTGTDNQNLDVGSFNTTNGELTIGIEDGTDQVIDLDGRYLETEVDGSVVNELQGFDIAQLSGTDLELSLTFDATTNTIDLSSLQDGTGTDDQTIDKLNLNGTTLEVSLEDDGEADQTVDLSSLQDGTGTDDQNISGSSFNSGNGELTIGIEGGTNETVDLDGRYLQSEVDGSVTNEGSLTVGAGTSTTSLINSNTSGSTPVTIEAGTGITLAESGNTITITGQAGSDDQNLDVGSFNTGNGELTIGIEDGTDQVIDLDGRYLITEVDGSTSNELQDFDVTNLNGTDLELSLTQDATTHTIDLSSLQDGTGTDNQNLSFDPKSGTDVTLNIQDGADVTLREGSNITLNRSASNLLEISATGDGTGTDDQNISGSSFASGTGNLTIGIENGTNEVVNLDGRYLETEVDGSTSNELQDFDIAQLTGTDLELSLTQDATTWTVDLSSLDGGSGIDTLADYDALRAYGGSSNVVYVQDFTVTYLSRDYTTIGGFFVKGGSGENGATIIDGWQRVFDGLNFYPDWFEMNGYDETGTDNGILQDNDRTNGAIILCNAAGGGVVHETPGRKIIGEGGNDAGVRYGVQLLDSVTLDMHGCEYYLKDALVDGTWSIGIIYAKGKKKIGVRNGFIHGNALNQTYTTYEQGGKVQGIRMYASQADRIEDVVIENMQIDYCLGNPINLYASSSVFANDYQDYTVRNLRCFHYGEGPQFINVNNLLVDQVYLDPDTPSVGDHFELVRCDGWVISNGRIIGGSGSGSGIDLYGNQNGTVQNWYITNTKDIIEIHKDSYSNYCQNIFINNLRGENRLETTPAAITFNNGQKETRNIHFKGLYLKDYYQGLAFSGADSIPGPIIVEDFIIDSMSNSGISIAHVKDLRLINGEVKRCGDRGIFWNTYQDATAETGKTSIKIENVHIHNNGNYGISMDLQNPAKTYWCDVDIKANVENNGNVIEMQIARALADTHHINVVNTNGIYQPSSASTSVWGRTDIFAFDDISSLSGSDHQKIRVHGKSGGIDVTSSAGTNRLVFLDSSSSVTLNETEWMDLQFNVDSVKWFETDRSDKTAIVDVHGKFTPSLEWPTLSSNNVLFWDGSNLAEDDDFTYENDELGFKRAFIQDSLKFGNTSTRCLIRYSGNYLFYQSLISNAGHLFRDHLGNNILQLDNADRGAQVYGPLTVRGGLKDGSLDLGTSGQVLRSTGTGVDWITGDLTDDQTLSWASGAKELTISGGNTVTLTGLDGGDVHKSGSFVSQGVPYATNDSTVTTEAAFTYDAGSNKMTIDNGVLELGDDSSNDYVLLSDLAGWLEIKRSGNDPVRVSSDLSGNLDFTTGGAQRASILGDGSEFQMGNFDFDITQSVGAGQDNFVLKYDNGTGLISLEADETGGGGGGGGDVYKSGTPANQQVAYWLNDSTIQSSSSFTFDGTTLEASDVESGTGYEFVTGATRHADIYWDGSDLIYQNATAASDHVFQNNIGQTILTLRNGFRDATFEDDVQVKGDLKDPGSSSGTSGQVATSLGSGSGWSWQDPAGIDSIELDLSPELGGDLHLGGNYFTETFTAGETMTTLDICTIDTDLTDGELYDASATDESRCSGYLFLTTEGTTNGTDTRVITEGKVTGFAGLTAGDIYYVSTVAGNITNVAPSGSGQIVRKIGQAINSTTLYFKPDETWVEVP